MLGVCGVDVIIIIRAVNAGEAIGLGLQHKIVIAAVVRGIPGVGVIRNTFHIQVVNGIGKLQVKEQPLFEVVQLCYARPVRLRQGSFYLISALR